MSAADPLDALEAAVEDARASGAEKLFDALNGYFDLLEEDERTTPHPEPGIELVATRLSKHFPDARAPLFLALRLVKAADWATWRRGGILLYLGRVRDPATLPALARVAAADADAFLRDLAREILAAFPPEALAGALVAEARYWAAR